MAIAASPGALGAGLGLAAMLATGWAMGFRHRVTPLHRKVDGIAEGVSEVLREVREGREGRDAADGTRRPRLSLVRRD